MEELPMYELTLTLQPRHYALTVGEQKKLMEDKLTKLKEYIEKTFEVCFSSVIELTKDLNVHSHCAITPYFTTLQRLNPVDYVFKDYVINWLRKQRKDLGRFSYSLVSYNDTYLRYLAKDIKYMRETCNMKSVIYNEHNLYDYQGNLTAEDYDPEYN